MNDTKKVGSVQSVKRTLKLLEVICAEKEIGIRELGRRTGFNRSTVQNFVSTMEEEGYLIKNTVTQKYYPSYKIVALGYQAVRRNDICSLARPVMEKIYSEFKGKGSIALSVLGEGCSIVYIDKIESHAEPVLSTSVGSRMPAHCVASGKAILAFFSEKERKKILLAEELKSYTNNTITDIDQLEQNLAEVRKNGYAISSEERISGFISVAAPISDYSERVVAAVSFAAFLNNIDVDDIPKIGVRLLNVSKEISELLGFKPS